MDPYIRREDTRDEEKFASLIATGSFPDFEQQSAWRPRSGSITDKYPNKRRDFAASTKFIEDFTFHVTQKYYANDVERRFRMPRNFFDQVCNVTLEKVIFFQSADRNEKEGI